MSTTSVLPSQRPRESPFHVRMLVPDVRTPVERNDARFVDHLVDDRHVAGALQDLVSGAVPGGEHPARHAARDAPLPRRVVLPVVLDVRQLVVSSLLRPRHDRHAPVGRIDDQRPSLGQRSIGGVVQKAGAGAAGRAIGIAGIQARRVALIEYFERRAGVVRPHALQIRLTVGRSWRCPALRRLGCSRRRSHCDRRRRQARSRLIARTRASDMRPRLRI